MSRIEIVPQYLEYRQTFHPQELLYQRDLRGLIEHTGIRLGEEMEAEADRLGVSIADPLTRLEWIASIRGVGYARPEGFSDEDWAYALRRTDGGGPVSLFRP